MTPTEWRDKTIADIHERQKKREAEKLKGEKDAIGYLIDQQRRWKKESSKIRKKSYRGK